MKRGKKIFKVIFMLFITLALGSCQTEEGEVTGPVSFSMLPVPLSSIRTATPLGNLNPPAHCLPTDHMYLYLEGSSLVPVQAMANGTVMTVHYNAPFNDYRIEFRHTATCISLFDHVKNPFPGIVEGAEVMAGDYIGYSDPTTAALDIGVADYDVTRYFISPQRYHEYTLHCGSPWDYFVEAVRNQLLTKNRRTIEPRGGKIDFDIDGTISGNWFHESLPTDDTSRSMSHGHLSFVYDMWDPTMIRITAGGTLALAPFGRAVVDNEPAPGSVTPSSGAVNYELVHHSSPSVLKVQMLDSRTIRVEVFPDKTLSDVVTFTSAAQIYVR